MIRLVLALVLAGCAATVPCGYWRDAGFITAPDGRRARLCEGARSSWYGWQTCRALYVAEGTAWIQIAQECSVDEPKAKRAPVRRLR